MRGEPNGSGHETDVLDSLACSIADGDPVDWTEATPSSDALSGKLEWLRVIEAISQVHRTEPTDDRGATPATPERPLPFTWGHLVVEEPLGAGSDCTVYRALDTNLGCAVALKLLKPDRVQGPSVERLLQEARRLAKIRHPNVPRCTAPIATTGGRASGPSCSWGERSRSTSGCRDPTARTRRRGSGSTFVGRSPPSTPKGSCTAT